MLNELKCGWLVYNCHGLDDEGWGPIRATYLEKLLDRLTKIDTVQIIPCSRALWQAGARCGYLSPFIIN